MRLIENPFTSFNDLDGRPLENGFLYVGEEGKDPQTAPIDVFFDEEGGIPAEQPIRTIAGYPARDGAPVKLYTEASVCSIRVRTAQGAQVFAAAAHSLSGSGGVAGGAIGLFSELASGDIEISNDVAEVRTSGWATAGDGGEAIYVVHPQATPSYVGAHPRAAFMAPDGRGWRLSARQRISPLMFGAVPGVQTNSPGVAPKALNVVDYFDYYTITATDQIVALNALEAFQWSVNPNVEMLTIDYSTGTWGLGSTYTIRTHYYRSHSYWGGRFQYTGSAALDTLVRIETLSANALILGDWQLFGLQSTGLSPLASRRVKRGLVFKGVGSSKLGRFYGSNFRKWLVDTDEVDSTAFNNNIGMRIERVHAVGCGAMGSAAQGISATFTATHTGSGSSSPQNQRSVLVLGGANAATIYDDLEIGDMVRLYGELYTVKEKDGSNTIKVFPWVVNPKVARGTPINSGTIWGMYGGAIYFRHRDTANAVVDQLAAMVCGTGVMVPAQYGCHVLDFLAESCGSTFINGNDYISVSRGIKIGNYHSEGTSSQNETIDGVDYQAGFEGVIRTGLRSEVVIDHVQATGADNDFNVLNGFRFIQSNDGTSRGTDTIAPQGFQMRFGGKVYHSTVGGKLRLANSVGIPIEVIGNADDRRDRTFDKQNEIILDLTYDEPADRFLGDHSHFDVRVIGTGAKGAPTQITVRLSAGDQALGFTWDTGGVADKVFVGLTQWAHIHGYYDWHAMKVRVLDLNA